MTAFRRKKMIKQTLVLVILLMTAPAWAVNKCKGSDGKFVFQDAPCLGEGARVDVRPASGTAGSTSTAESQAALDSLKQKNALSEAIRTHKPMVGMTVVQLEKAMGLATKVNADNYNGTTREQVIYERPSETWLVYTRNGIVESIQHRPGAPIGMPNQRMSGPCPTQHEINSAITSASSMTLSDLERAERWKAIKAMQACK